MWVCVSDDFALKTIVQRILKSATRKFEIFEKLEMDQLQKCLREEIDGKKYFLVLDDIWNENLDKWLKLKTLLENRVKGSKILVTTRSERVANIMSKAPLIYVLRGLTEDKSRSLFTKITFEQGEEPKDSRLVEIGKDIVAKCAGVPLAIRTIGRLLYCKNKQEDWLTFRNQELSEIDQEEGDILPILKLSYYHLSPQLKQCFAYCVLFPKDYEFEKEELIQLWMAQGFVGGSKKSQCSEHVGNEYFMDLLLRSFLQDLKEEECEYQKRRLVTCKMHDLIHDLAQSVIGSECNMMKSEGDNIDERNRHISFAPNLRSLKISTAMLQRSCLRTFLPLNFDTELSNFHFSKFISSFRCLRTLKLCNLKIRRLPTSIGKLKHLRYLDLSYNRLIKKLPNSMSKLINLQTLNLNGCRKLKMLPKDMKKMVSLQYLMIDGCYSLTCMPHGLGRLTGLRRLSLFVVHKKDRENEALRELKGLNKLRGSLTIKVLGDEENIVNLAEANLEEKQYLESLRLEGSIGYGRMIVEGLKPHPNLKELRTFCIGSVMFSGCMSSFTHLSKVQIGKSHNLRSITLLGQLPSLFSLRLEQLENLEYLSESDRVGDHSSSTAPKMTFFPSLEELGIQLCSRLKGWWKINDNQVTTTIEEEAEVLLSFPRLSGLFICDCPEWTCMPLYPTVEELYLWDASSKTLQQTMKMKIKTSAYADAAGPSTSYPAFPAPSLSNLKSLSLRSVNDLECLPELLQRVSSLVEMDLSYSPKLISQLPQCIRHLSSLQKLTIRYCDQHELQFDDDDDCQWQGLESPLYLEICGVENMERLPKWINHITTLQQLDIEHCSSLTFLLEGMQLDKLEIRKCPQLIERCGNNKGVEWPKIAHIPNILIDLRWIQLEGHYQGDGA